MCVLACAWLAALSGCDAVKSEGLTQREYRRVLIEELCAPGGFYSECWWTDATLCHEEMAHWVADCIPSEPERVQPSEALRKKIFECVFHFHYMFVDAVISIEEKEECVDAKRWKHVPPGREDAMRRFRAGWSKGQVFKSHYVPADPDTVTDTAPDIAPEPSPGDAVPDQAPAP
jgi:hypothetical protein